MRYRIHSEVQGFEAIGGGCGLVDPGCVPEKPKRSKTRTTKPWLQHALAQHPHSTHRLRHPDREEQAARVHGRHVHDVHTVGCRPPAAPAPCGDLHWIGEGAPGELQRVQELCGQRVRHPRSNSDESGIFKYKCCIFFWVILFTGSGSILVIGAGDGVLSIYVIRFVA